jgi:Ran GTPase-activating protein (RanGAP) involved in mRNA processing and transport
LETEITNYISTIGEHRDNLRTLRAQYKALNRPPTTKDFVNMADSIRKQLLADALDDGDMDNEDKGDSAMDEEEEEGEAAAAVAAEADSMEADLGANNPVAIGIDDSSSTGSGSGTDISSGGLSD